EAFLLARLQTLAEILRVMRFRGVRVAADLVANLAAEHLLHGHAISFAREIPQRHCDAPHTPPAWRESPPNCWIFRKILSRLQGFSPAAAFEEQGVGLAGAIAHLPARGCPGWHR